MKSYHLDNYRILNISLSFLELNTPFYLLCSPPVYPLHQLKLEILSMSGPMRPVILYPVPSSRAQDLGRCHRVSELKYRGPHGRTMYRHDDMNTQVIHVMAYR